MAYKHHSIQINGRTVLIDDILNNRISGQSEFESSTFSFIQAWSSDTNNFEFTTSGSTGEPKKIDFTREQLRASAKRTIQALQLNQNITALVCLDTKFIAGAMMLVRAFEGGMKVIAVDPSSNPLSDLKHSIDFVALVPLQLQTILQQGDARTSLSSINTVIIGGAPLSNTHQASLQNLKCSIFATYGMTETMSHIALQKLNGDHKSEYFNPLPGIQLTADERGCLIIHTPELEQAVVTNDLVEFKNETSFKIIGRWDSVINSGGVKVHPDKIEQALNHVLKELRIDKSSCVTFLPDPKLGERVIAIVESVDLNETLHADILKKLSEHLTSYEVPKKIYSVSNFVYTPTGKINRLKTKELISE